MFSAILSFLGGSVFRMIWGEVSSWLTKRQDHAQEMARMELQERFAAAQHERNLAAIKIQAELGVQAIRVQGEENAKGIELDAWREAVGSIGRQSGIWIVDLWNGMVRPMLATICIALWVMHLNATGWKLDDQSWSILGAVLGLYVADRSLVKRGK